MPKPSQIPLRLKPYRIAPYHNHFVAENLLDHTYLFLDAEEKALVKALGQSLSIEQLVQFYQREYGRYAYKKVHGLIAGLLRKSFLAPDSQEALLSHPDWRAFAPDRRDKWVVSFSTHRLARIAEPFLRPLFSTLGLMFLLACLVFLGASLASVLPGRNLFVLRQSFFLSGLCWVLCLAAVYWLKFFFRNLLLESRGVDLPIAALRLRWGLPSWAVDDNDVMMHGWGTCLRFHLASLLLPGLFAVPALGCLQVPALADLSVIWMFSCALVIWFDLAPFLPGELQKALDRLSGRAHLLRWLQSFVRRKFLVRLLHLQSNFRFEAAYVLFGLLALIWLGGTFAVSSHILQRWGVFLLDGLIIQDALLEKIAVLVFYAALVVPFLLPIALFLVLLGFNFYALAERKFRQSFQGQSLEQAGITEAEVARRLEGTGMFASVEPGVQEVLAGCFVVWFARGKQNVVWQGERTDSFLVLHEGRARVIQEEENGVQNTVALLSAGDSFGEEGLLDAGLAGATVQAETAVVFLALKRSAFEAFVRRKPEAGAHLTERIRQRSFLKGLALFQAIPAEDFDRLMRSFEWQGYPAGTVILREGEPGRALYLILEGTAEVWQAYDTPARIRLAALGRGEYFGEMSLLAETPCTATVKAGTDLSVVSLPAETLHRLLEDNHICEMLLGATLEQRRKALAPVK